MRRHVPLPETTVPDPAASEPEATARPDAPVGIQAGGGRADAPESPASTAAEPAGDAGGGVASAPPRRPGTRPDFAAIGARLLAILRERREREKAAGWIAGGTVAAIVLGGGLAFWAMGGSHLPEPRVVPPGSDPRPPRVLAPDRRPAAGAPWQDGPADLFAEPETVMDGFRAPLRLAAPYDVVDSMTFRSGEIRVRLAHVEGVRRGDVCFGEDGLKFACGLMGRASLANFLRSNPVVCHPVSDPDEASSRIVAQCFVGATDLAQHQIRAGLARPVQAATGSYLQAEEAARAARAGAWNGGWSLMDLPEEKRNGT